MSEEEIIEEEVEVSSAEEPTEEKTKAEVRNNIAVQGNNPLAR